MAIVDTRSTRSPTSVLAAQRLLRLSYVGFISLGLPDTVLGAAWLRARWGTGSVLVGSTLLAASALLSTALAQHWLQILAAALVAGLGGGAIDATLNDHVARNYEARQLSWLHACWGVGAASAPLVIAAVLASGTSWRFAYGALAIVEMVLSLSFLRTAAL